MMSAFVGFPFAALASVLFGFILMRRVASLYAKLTRAERAAARQMLESGPS